MLVLAEQNRTFGYAAAASVAVHALVLLMNPPAVREALAPPAEPPLVAHIAKAAPPPAPSAPQPKEEGQQKEESQQAMPKPPALAKRVEKPRLKRVPRPSKPVAPAVPAPAPPPAAIEPPQMEAQPPPADAPASPAAPAAPPAVASIAPSPPAPAPDPAEALASFREQIKEVAGRYKRYPPVARDNGWTGDVVVRIEMAASGEVASIRVKTSSGYEVLDAQALEMFRKAVPAVRVPAQLRGKEFAVELRAIYNLRDRPG